MGMTKKEFVEGLATKLNTTHRDAELVFDTVWVLLKEAIVKGAKFTISGFGTFRLKERKPRTARNPKTGASVKVGASKTIAFKASHGMKDELAK
jgi:DNA-binding protein HU-beta